MTQEAEEVDQQLVEAGGGGRLGVEVAVDEVVDNAGQMNMMSMKGETSGSSIWKMRMLGRAKSPMALLRTKASAMLPDGLQGSKRPAEALAHQSLGVDGRLGEGQRAVLVDDLEAQFEQGHGEVGVFGDGVDGVAAGGFDRARCAMRRWRRGRR